MFDPPGKEDDARRRVDTALILCGNCPVAARCLIEAIASQDSGVRGGQLLRRGHPVPLPVRRRYKPRTAAA